MNPSACTAMPTLRAAWLGWICLVLAGCQAMAPPRADETLPPDAEPAEPAQGAEVFQVVPGESEVRVLVYRGGPLARFGHNHVMRSTAVQGEVLLGENASQSGFRLSLPVASFQVDPSAARAAEGGEFDSEPSGEAIRDTRDNMLGAQVLDAEAHPRVEIRSVTAIGPRWNPDVRVRITLRGHTRDLVVPVAVTRCGDRLVIIAAFSLRQSDFGITPFTALNGGLQVQDTVRIRTRIVARSRQAGHPGDPGDDCADARVGLNLVGPSR